MLFRIKKIVNSLCLGIKTWIPDDLFSKILNLRDDNRNGKLLDLARRVFITLKNPSQSLRLDIRYRILDIFQPRLLFAFLLASCFLLPASHAFALTVSPVIIDRKALPRDIIEEKIKLRNDAGGVQWYYAFVNNVDSQEGKEDFTNPAHADFSESLANWIEFTRGVITLGAGEERELPLTIRVNLRAKPGTYHAQIVFGVGGTQAEAAAAVEQGQIEGEKVLINIEILEDVKEYLQLKKFAADKAFFSGFPVSFSYGLENIGNRSLKPSGQIRIYNRRGEEVAAVSADNATAAIQPKSVAQLASAWEVRKTSAGRDSTKRASVLESLGNAFSDQVFSQFGRYKAVLNLTYGAQNKVLQDTTFFWVLPLQLLFVLFVICAVCVVYGVLWWHGRYALQRESGIRNLESRIRKAEPQDVPLLTKVERVEKNFPLEVAEELHEKLPEAPRAGHPFHKSRHIVNLREPIQDL